MYNSFWLEDREVHFQCYLWRDSEADDISDYAITKVNIMHLSNCYERDCMAAKVLWYCGRTPCAGGHVCRQHAHYLQWLDLKSLWVSAETLGLLWPKWEVPWGQPQEDRCCNIVLPNQLSDEDHKALSMGYAPFNVELPSKIWKTKRLSENSSKEEVIQQASNPLNRRVLLS